MFIVVSQAYKYFQRMLAVHQEQSSSPQLGTEELEPSMIDPAVQQAKERPRSKLLNPLNILILLAVLSIIGFGTYYFMNLTSETDVKSSINEAHGKIVSFADSSKKEGSNSGSSSSKSSNSNNKPNPKSLPASKGVISSNPGLNTGSGNEEPDGDDDEGDKRDKKLKKGSSTDVTSTEEESEEEDEESQEPQNDEGVYWVDSKLQGNGAPPLVGNARP